MAGARAPRARYLNSAADSAAANDSSEPFGDEARLFTETRLLQRSIQVQLIALPPTPISSAGSGPTFFIGHVFHPAGNIAQLLVANGFARCVDQHAALLGAEGMSGLRNAEKQAKNNRAGIWSSLPAQPIVPGGGSRGAAGSTESSNKTPTGLDKEFEGIVSRVWNAESLSVRQGKHGEGKEVKVFLASIRQPRCAHDMMFLLSVFWRPIDLTAFLDMQSRRYPAGRAAR